MRLAAGQRLGPYEILSPLGAGGMGEVYRARDPRLSREVALKVLTVEVAGDAERLARFEQEARAASALQHPGILAVFDVGEHEGTNYLVTELLEGESLRERLAEGGMPPRKVLELGAQMAAALAAAHERGIVHRDLKPENIFLTREGRAKILDFGLARLQPLVGSSSEVAAAPTALAGTSPGMVLGTVGYMAPEQVRGQTVDARADLFSLGAVLHEMLTGRRAFERDSNADTLAAILREEPEDLGGVPGVPPALERLIARCLEKKPADRFASAHDLAFALEAVGASRATSSVAAAPTPQSVRLARFGRLGAGAAAALALALSFFAGSRFASSPAASSVRSPHGFMRLTEERGAESFPALSPDGSAVAFSVNRPAQDINIWLQRVGGRNAINLTADCNRNDRTPSFSPDGTRIAFSSECGGGGLFVMGASGENRRRLATRGFNPDWLPDGSAIVYSTESFLSPVGRNLNGELWRVDVAGGQETMLFAGDAVEPRVSPHGKRIAYWALPETGSQRDIWTIPAAGLRGGDQPVAVTQDAALDWNPLWAADGRELYFLSDRGGSWNLWRIAIDEESGRPRGEPQPALLPATRVAQATMSRDGRRLAFLASQNAFWIEKYGFDPVAGRVLGAAEKIWETTRAGYPYGVSPDDRFLAGTVSEPVEDIVLYATDGSGMRQLTDDAARDRNPTFSPEGHRIAFQSDRSGHWEIWTMGPDGSGLAQLTRQSGMLLTFPQWLPDGRLLMENDVGKVAVLATDEQLARKPEILMDPGEGKSLSGVTFNRDASLFMANLAQAGGAAPPAIVAWKAGDREPEILLEEAGFGELLLMPDGRHVVWTRQGEIVILDRISREQRPLSEVARAGGRDPGVASVLLSPDGRTLYVQRANFLGDLWLAELD